MKKIYLFFAVLLSVTFVSCDKVEDTSNVQGSLKLNFSQSATNQRISETALDAIIVTIQDSEGNIVKEDFEIQIEDFGAGYISTPVALEAGDYQLTELMVVDINDAVLYATPMEGSELAQLVIDPLPISFSIIQDEVTNLEVEVISTEEQTPAAFGYSSLALNIVPTFNFQIGAFIYNATNDTYEMTDAELIIVAGEDTIQTTPIADSTTLVTTKDNYANYTLYVSKAGYSTFQQTIDNETLKNFYGTTGEPFVAVIEEGLSTTLVLQPHGEEGKDALIWSYSSDPSIDRSEYIHMEIAAWTTSGTDDLISSLLEFDLSSIPANTTISSAALSLYHCPNTTKTGHTGLGDNAVWIERITSSWVDSEVQWNTQPSVTETNRVFLPASTSSTQDYLDTDVTVLVQDMVNDPANSHGFMLSIDNTTPYRNMLFASSDYEDASKHPKLVISY